MPRFTDSARLKGVATRVEKAQRRREQARLVAAMQAFDKANAEADPRVQLYREEKAKRQARVNAILERVKRQFASAEQNKPVGKRGRPRKAA